MLKSVCMLTSVCMHTLEGNYNTVRIISKYHGDRKSIMYRFSIGIYSLNHSSALLLNVIGL